MHFSANSKMYIHTLPVKHLDTYIIYSVFETCFLTTNFNLKQNVDKIKMTEYKNCLLKKYYINIQRPIFIKH